MSEENPILIEVKDLHKRFGDKEVLRGVSFEIRGNAVTTIIGKSGEGKSVLLKCIAGILTPTSGEVHFNGGTELREGEAEEQLNYMFQHNALFDSLTAFENVALPLRERTRMKHGEIQRRVRRLFRKLDLHGVEDAFPADLSGGMQKRVALARALVFNPRIVLFDEPTTGLDPVRKNAVFTMIERYQEVFGYTAVLVSHDLPDALYFSDHVIMLRDGKVAFSGTPLQLEQSAEAVADEFLNSREDLQDELVGLGRPAEFNEALADLQAKETSLAVILIDDFSTLFKGLGELGAYLLESSLVRFLRQSLRLPRSSGFSLERGCFVLPLAADAELPESAWAEAMERFQAHLSTLGSDRCVAFSIRLHLVPASVVASSETLPGVARQEGRALLTHRC